MRKMIKIFGFTALAALLIGFSFASQVWAGDEKTGEVKMQSVCPIMGNPINKEVFADHDGKRVYFCCAECIPKFNEDPAGFIAKMEKDGITLAKTPEADHDKGHAHDDHPGHDHG
jgi:YHS domain-containing protein